jgi:hypothetical protein
MRCWGNFSAIAERKNWNPSSGLGAWREAGIHACGTAPHAAMLVCACDDHGAALVMPQAAFEAPGQGTEAALCRWLPGGMCLGAGWALPPRTPPGMCIEHKIKLWGPGMVRYIAGMPPPRPAEPP